MKFTIAVLLVALTASLSSKFALALAPPSDLQSRRSAMKWLAGACVGAPTVASAVVDTEDFIRTGMVSMPMGVSGQAGKSKPTTGVVLRDGSEVNRDSRSGDVLAEILVKEVF